jgi:hypothetical protein
VAIGVTAVLEIGVTAVLEIGVTAVLEIGVVRLRGLRLKTFSRSARAVLRRCSR